MNTRAYGAVAVASAFFVLGVSSVAAGDLKQYQAKPIEQYQSKPAELPQSKPVEHYQARPVEQYQSKPVEQYTARSASTGAADFAPPAGWSFYERTETGTVYRNGPCYFAIGGLKPADGSFESSAEAYLESAVRRNIDRGEVVERLTGPTRLGNTGIITRAFTAQVKETATWNIRIVAPQAGAMRPLYLRCTDGEAFKEQWPIVGQSIVEQINGGGGSGSAQSQRQGGGIHLFTQEERQAMMRNDTAAGRTRDSMLSGRDSGNAAGGGAGGARLFLGTWYGANVMGQIDIHPDGTYSSPNGARGAWQATGARSLVFTSGPLTAWNGGNATVSDKNALEFKWTTPQGQKQYFVYIRR